MMVLVPDHLPADLPSMVDSRAGLLAQRGRSDPEAAELAEQLRAVLGHGAQLRRIEPATDPADEAMAEGLVAAEPVNPAGSPAESRRRFEADRRVFVLEHPLLPGRAINVVWVALCTGCPNRLGEMLEPSVAVLDPAEADTAVFYSIWNAEAGLAGLGNGRELITAATQVLRQELPQLETLTTMSPIPGFRSWQETRSTITASQDLLASCARYLTTTDADRRLLDPVAGFHMGNGARLWQLLPGADPSRRGSERSFGIMANYRYFPEDLEANRRCLAEADPPVGRQVADLLAD